MKTRKMKKGGGWLNFFTRKKYQPPPQPNIKPKTPIAQAPTSIQDLQENITKGIQSEEAKQTGSFTIKLPVFLAKMLQTIIQFFLAFKFSSKKKNTKVVNYVTRKNIQQLPVQTQINNNNLPQLSNFSLSKKEFNKKYSKIAGKKGLPYNFNVVTHSAYDESLKGF